MQFIGGFFGIVALMIILGLIQRHADALTEILWSIIKWTFLTIITVVGVLLLRAWWSSMDNSGHVLILVATLYFGLLAYWKRNPVKDDEPIEALKLEKQK